MLPAQRKLPLFPLNVVLFPGATTPLHIFEDRYKLMMQRCLDSDTLFGIVLIKSGKEVGEPAEPYTVGTIGSIAEYEQGNDGRLFMRVIGEQRFRIGFITQLKPYIEAEVDILEDGPATPLTAEEYSAVHDTVLRHQRLVVGMRGGWVSDIKLPSDATELSYHLGSLAQSAMLERQQILEESSPPARLQMGLRLLEHEIEILKQHVANEMRKRVGG